MAKAKYEVNNWSKYNTALANRDSVTFWLDKKAVAAWHDCDPNGQRGRDNQLNDTAITAALMIQVVFGLSLRQTQGFIDSIFTLMGLDLRSPTYSSISKRAKNVDIDIRRSKGPPAHLVFDATGLQVYGEGEWKMRKHGKEKRRTWRKVLMATAISFSVQICWLRDWATIKHCQVCYGQCGVGSAGSMAMGPTTRSSAMRKSPRRKRPLVFRLGTTLGIETEE